MKKKTIKALGLDRPRRDLPPNPANIASRLRRIKTELDLMSGQISAFLDRHDAGDVGQHEQRTE